jgi:antitoxin (DNA-binding transcriptional repressor) of toxin-antitoxin stability system
VNRSAIGEKIEVAYSGRTIAQLTAISARLVNSGSLPIDSSDVKDGEFPKLIFPSNILNFEIKSRSPQDIKADAYWETNVARVVHGLLNPGDALNLQVILEGDAGEITNLPRISYRISGIKEPRTLYPSLSTRPPSVTCFTFSATTEYVIMALAACSAILMWLLVVGAASQGIDVAFPEKGFMAKAARIRNRIDMNASGKNLQESTASAFWSNLGKPYDGYARESIGALMPLATESSADYVERVFIEVEKKVLPHAFRERMNGILMATIFAFLVTLCVAVASTLVTIGSWRILIGK